MIKVGGYTRIGILGLRNKESWVPIYLVDYIRCSSPTDTEEKAVFCLKFGYIMVCREPSEHLFAGKASRCSNNPDLASHRSIREV